MAIGSSLRSQNHWASHPSTQGFEEVGKSFANIGKANLTSGYQNNAKEKGNIPKHSKESSQKHLNNKDSWAGISREEKEEASGGSW